MILFLALTLLGFVICFLMASRVDDDDEKKVLIFLSIIPVINVLTVISCILAYLIKVTFATLCIIFSPILAYLIELNYKISKRK